MNNLSVAANLVTAPASAFAELRERPRFWFPLLLVVLTSMFVIGWYYSVVDIDWLKDLMFANNPKIQQLPADQRAAAMNMVGRNTMLYGSLFGILIGVPFFCVITALYYWLVASITKVPLGFKHWFSLVCWTALPGLLSTVIAVILLLLRDNNQMLPTVLQPLSLNELAFHRPLGSSGQTFLDSVNIPAILGCVLAIIGVRVWTQRSWQYSVIVAVIPLLLIWGIFAILSFR